MKKLYSKIVAGVTDIGLLLVSVFVFSISGLAQTTAPYAGIVQKAGNDEMKAYGAALEAGTLTPTVKTETIPTGSAVTYYVDATNGNDSNPGTSSATAWKSVNKVNTVTFNPGDRILFKAGEIWTAPTAPKTNGSLSPDIDEDQDGRPENFITPHGSGTASAYIILGAYGTGALPKFVGGANVNTVVSFKDQEYWDISNIDVSNVDPAFNPSNPSSTPNAKLMGNLRGIQVYGQSHSDDGVTPGGVLDGFIIHDTFIHDICGHVYWGGSPADRGYPGVYGNMGNDASKRTGGIVFEIWRPTTENDLTDAQKASGTMDRPITFNNIVMRNNVICNTSFGGITVKQWGGVGHAEVNVGDFHVAAVTATNENWYIPQGDRSAANGWYDPNDGNYHPHTNMFIENNYVSNNKTEYGCNTIRVASTNGGLLAHNLCNGAGTCGIEIDFANDIVVQYNEVYDTRRKMGGVDNNGIDFDQGTSNCLAQYNYLHGNGDGFLACGWNMFGTAVWRYNIIQNSGSGDFYLALYNTKGFNYFHNNLLYSSNNATSLVGRPGDFKVDYAANPLYYYNNIFFSNSTTTGPTIYDGTYSTYSNNSFYGPKVTKVAEDVNAVTENPGFTGNFTSDIEALKISQYSPLINAGKEVTYPSTFGGTFASGSLYNLDFFGNSASSGASRDIGLQEYQFTAGKGIIRGYVKDKNGNPAPGVTVKLQGTSATATSQSSGYYSFGELPEGAYTLVATKENYTDGQGVQQSVAAGAAVNVALNLGDYQISTGTISGTVTVSGGAAVAGAKLTLSRDGQTFEATANSLGQYSFLVPGFESGPYTLVVSKSGYLDLKKDLVVRNGAALTQNFILRSGQSTCLLDESFNSYTAGTFSSNTTWNASAGGGTITIVSDPSTAGNQYLRLNKTGSGTLAVYNKINTNATGIVTIEARVMRTTDAGSINQLGMYSYNTTDFGSGGTIPPSTGRLATFAVNKSSTRDYLTHDGPGTPDAGDYTLNKWDTIRIVVNLTTKTFDFYVNDLITPTLTNKTLRTTNRDAIDKFLIYGNATNIGDLCVDYFRVCMETVDKVAPKVTSITRKAPESAQGAETSVTYRVTFSEDVTGVDPSDFSLNTTGNLSGAISSVTAVSGSIYDVVVNELIGEGDMRLDVKAAGTTIADAAANNLDGGFTTGDLYTRTKNSQTITFNSLENKKVGDDDVVLSATASSSLAVSYSSSNPDVATVTGNILHIVGAGTATITASQAGDNSYKAASDVAQQLTIGKKDQVITFTAIGEKSVGDADFDAGATASSGLALTYTSSNTAVASLVNGMIHIVGPGSTTITASQAGNGNFNEAPSVSQVLMVIKRSQTITFNTLSPKQTGDADFDAGATASSGLAVSYVSSNTAVATIVNGKIHIVGAGESTITASQAGNEEYNAAPAVSQPVSVFTPGQSITFNALPVKQVGDADFDAGATASSGLAVSYSSSNLSVATIVNGKIHIVGAGSSTIIAVQEGNSTYSAAASKAQTLTVTKRDQTITFNGLPAKQTGDVDFVAGATASSGLAVSYVSSNTTVATVINGKIHIVSAGTSIITASQAGDATYAPATSINQTLTVTQTQISLVKVRYQDGDNGQTTNNAVRPNLTLVNDGTTAIPYAELTARYWFTAENYVGINTWIDYAQLGNNNVKMKYVALDQPRNGALGYIEYSFTSAAGNLSAGGNSGPIQSRFANTDWTNLTETNDFSYQAFSTYALNDHITLYRNGMLIWGSEPTLVTPQNKLIVYSENKNSNTGSNTISTYLKINNEGNLPVAYEDVSVRYWFTAEGTQNLNSWIDYAVLGSSNLITQFVRNVGRTTADSYFELKIKPTVGTLYPGSSTGNIQYRIAKADWSNFNETNDYSYKPAGMMAENNHITVYYKGQLIYGTEPASGARLAAEEPETSLQVRLLGNPVLGDQAQVEIWGGENQPLKLQLISITGTPLQERFINSAALVEEQSLPLGNVSPGVYLLRVSSPNDSVVVKVFRQ